MSTPTPTTEPCLEDQPCWDCTTMGNGICGEPQPTPTSEPTPTTWPVIVVDNAPNVYDDVCIDEGNGVGVTRQVFLPCDPNTWPGPVATAPHVAVPTTTPALPVTGATADLAVAGVGTVLILLGALCLRVVRR